MKDNTVDLRPLGWSSCGENAWQRTYTEDNGANGYDVFKDPKTGKFYQVEWVRKVEAAEELPSDDECQECGAENDDINTCNNCGATLCLDCDENEMPCGADGHTYCTPCVSKLFKEEDYEEY